MPPATPATFLDRDDTLIHCDGVAQGGDLGDPALVKLLPGVAEGCRALKDAGFTLVVVSNQGGVARGKYGVTDVERVNARLNQLLDGLIDAFYFCPYHPSGTVAEFAREHPWRKPQPGMLLDAATALSIDLARSWTVGDKQRDIEAGQAAGTRTIRISPSLALQARSSPKLASGESPWRPPVIARSDPTRGFVEDSSASASAKSPHFVAPDFLAAVEIILRECKR